MGRVIVVGSINVDLVVTAARLPRPGETVQGGVFRRHFGGKGANQAVAAARAGASVVMIGAVGRDADGGASVAALAAEGIDVARVREADAPTGVAIIAVADDGENQIVVAPGANATLSATDMEGSRLPAGDVLLTCLEIPMVAVIAAATNAAGLGMQTIVNPAPAQPLPDELIAARPILTPNLDELLAIGGAAEREGALRRVILRGVPAVAVTMGADGVLLAEGERRVSIPARRVRAVDATGAGDTFSGVLAAWLADGHSLDEAATAANAAAGISVTHPGAREGMPSRAQIEALLRG
jgi:ribokinase